MYLQVNKNQFQLVSDNGKGFNIVPSFDKDFKVLQFLDGVNIKKIIKRQSKQTYKSKKDNKERHFYNFYLITENNKSIQIKVPNEEDLRVLDCISEYVK